jgi:hypothetical protein
MSSDVGRDLDAGERLDGVLEKNSIRLGSVVLGRSRFFILVAAPDLPKANDIADLVCQTGPGGRFESQRLFDAVSNLSVVTVHASALTVICNTCGSPFTGRRSTARFCSPRCRLVRHRASALEVAATGTGAPAGALLSVSGAHSLPAPLPKKRETLWASRGPERLPQGILRDERYPNMYRVVLPDGSLSDTVNLARAKDALAAVGDGSAA